jgi:hypothetical protein
MNLQQIKKQAEEDIKRTLGGHIREEKVYFENDKELMQFDIFGFVNKYIDLTAEMYEKELETKLSANNSPNMSYKNIKNVDTSKWF